MSDKKIFLVFETMTNGQSNYWYGTRKEFVKKVSMIGTLYLKLEIIDIKRIQINQDI